MMKYFTHTNAGKLKLNFRAKMNLLTTGLIFVLLLLSTFLGNGVMILLIHHGFINAGPPSSQIPLLIQTGIISIIIGTLITLLISTCRSNLSIHWSRLFIKYPQEIMMLKSTWNTQQNSEKYLIALIT